MNSRERPFAIKQLLANGTGTTVANVETTEIVGEQTHSFTTGCQTWIRNLFAVTRALFGTRLLGRMIRCDTLNFPFS